MKKDKQYCVRLTEKQVAQLHAKAQKAGLSCSEFIRRSIGGKIIKEAPPADLPTFIIELRELVRICNLLIAQGTPANETELKEIISRAEFIEDMIIDTYRASN